MRGPTLGVCARKRRFDTDSKEEVKLPAPGGKVKLMTINGDYDIFKSFLKESRSKTSMT